MISVETRFRRMALVTAAAEESTVVAVAEAFGVSKHAMYQTLHSMEPRPKFIAHRRLVGITAEERRVRHAKQKAESTKRRRAKAMRDNLCTECRLEKEPGREDKWRCKICQDKTLATPSSLPAVKGPYGKMLRARLKKQRRCLSCCQSMGRPYVRRDGTAGFNRDKGASKTLCGFCRAVKKAARRGRAPEVRTEMSLGLGQSMGWAVGG